MSVTVVIPIYNSSETIVRCLESVKSQSEQNFDIICVDDGSTDDSVQKVHDWKSANSNIEVQLIEQENSGAPAARNKGWRFSNRKYIQFLDADDVLLPTKIEQHLKVMNEAPSQPGVLAGAYQVEIPEMQLTKTVLVSDEQDILFGLFKGQLGITSSNFFSRQALVTVDGWDDTLKSSQEYDLMFKMYKSGTEFIVSNDPLTIVYRGKDTSITSRNRGKNIERFVALRTRILKYARQQRKEGMSKFYQIYFDSLRVLYPHNPELACSLYDQNIPQDWTPSTSPTTGRGYLILYRLFGFRLAERIKRKIRAS